MHPTRPLLTALAAALLGLSLARSADAPGDGTTAPHVAGRHLFEQRWSVAPSAFGRWGRGPTSNGEACADCHVETGRGSLPATPDDPLREGVLRLSQRVGDLLLPHRAYGDQLQYQGVLGKVPGEGEVYVEWLTHGVTLGDGTRVELRAPRVRLSGLAFGALGDATIYSLRLAPSLAGLGAFEQVSAATLERVAARQRARGLSGRVNLLADSDGAQPRVGRFGYKATQPDLRAQSASALFMDLGITSSGFPAHDCPPVQWECAAHAASGPFEIADDEIDALAAYLRGLAAPVPLAPSTATLREGARLFAVAGCDGCHVPALEREAHLAPLRAYTDLLLHDLGRGLSDDRPEGGAGATEWRTAALWGMRAYLALTPRPALLHDGRARSVAEAILWHDGEARAAREAFARMSSDQRQALATFVESL